ncbi:MAG: hypothetical protein ACFFBP_08775 [Promethearchaeota archaeon]
MEFKRYRKWIFLYFGVLVFIIILIVIQVILYNYPSDYNITTNNLMLDFLILFILVSIFSTIGGIFLGYLFGPLYLWFHEKLIGKKMLYGFRSKPNSEKLKGIFTKLFFPALMVMNFSFLLYDNPILRNILIDPDTSFGLDRLMVITWLFPWFSIVGLGFFSGAYFLNDAGIIYSNKNKVRNDVSPVELRSVGNWYIQFLKGYAGIAVFLNLYELITSMVNALNQPGQLIIIIIFLISWPFMPFILAFLMIPAIIGLDLTFERRKKYMLKYAEKRGIKGMIDDPLDLK